MRYILRIAAVISGVIVASAVLAIALNHFMVVFGVVTDIDSVGMFVGLTTSGCMAALLTRDSWLAVQ
jgi:hypothetical protein